MKDGSLQVMGLSHRTAPVAVREKYALDEEAAALLLAEVSNAGEVDEVVVLSTCNRTELYYTMPGEEVAKEAGDRILSAVANISGGSADDLAPYVYEKEGMDAVKHLFRVASSLDSLVIGEPQILGQVKDAFRLAKKTGTVKSRLGKVFEKSFKVAKEVRRVTAVGEGRVSVGSVAVDLAGKVFGDLSKCSILLIGAGKMAEAVASALSDAGGSRVTVANRTGDRARMVADRYGWRGVTLDGVADLLKDSDMVIASVSSSGWIVDRDRMKGVMALRRFRPVFMVDISLPRVIDPEAGRLEGVYLYNIDDFNQIIAEYLMKRSQDVDTAEVIIDREMESVRVHLRETEIQPIIGLIQRRSMELRDREVERALKSLGEVDDEQRTTIEAMATSIVNRILHNPIMALRHSTGEDPGVMTRTVKDLFGLDDNRED